jgi:signal transduction histidine kinase
MAATGAKMAKAQPRPTRRTEKETREQAVMRRLAELVAQRDWSLVQAGRSLHDDLGQVLTAAGIRFDLMSQEAAQKYPEIAATLSELQALLEECQMRTRVISQQLNRSTVDRVGLRSALERARDRWEPGFAGFLSVDCPPDVRPPAGAARAILAMAEFAMELACNRITCTTVEVIVEKKGNGYEARVFLENLVDPLDEIEAEVRWQIVRGACQLAGGMGRIDLATPGRNGTILKAHFV